MIRWFSFQFILAVVLLVGFVSLFSLCVSSVAAMSIFHQGSCGMADHTAMCSTTIQEHLAFWQKVLVSTGSKSTAGAVFLLVGILFVACSGSDFREAIARQFTAYLRHLLRHRQLHLFDHLFEQFSQGILHPKIY